MKYLDFLLRLDAGPGEGCVVRLVSSPAGQEKAPFETPRVTQEVAGIAVDLERALENRHGDPGRDLAPPGGPPVQQRQEEIGARLFQALFPEPIRNRYCQSLGHASQGQDLGLRIKLQMSLDDGPQVTRIHSLPWEYLYGDKGFLARDRSISITRHLDLPLPGGRPPIKPPLRVLIVISRPSGLPSLPHGEQELRAIERLARQDSKLQVTVLPAPTLGALREALLAESYHVLHFIGHGGFEAATGEGVLYLEDEAGNAVPVSGTVLSDHLRGIPSLRLVFLNACQTARAAAPAPFAGVATALLGTGIPAVVAMQFPITDQAASAFGEKLYQRLISGDRLETAVAEGRLAILRYFPKSPEWGTPVLFLRAPDSKVLMKPTLNWKPWIAAAIVILALWAGLTQKPSQGPELGNPEIDQPETEQRGESRQPDSPPPSPQREPQKTPQDLAPGTYELIDPKPLFIPELNRQLTADFYWAWGSRRARLYLENVKEPQRFMGPGTVNFKTPSGTCSVYVGTIDYDSEALTIRPLSGPC